MEKNLCGENLCGENLSLDKMTNMRSARTVTCQHDRKKTFFLEDLPYPKIDLLVSSYSLHEKCRMGGLGVGLPTEWTYT